MKRSALLGALLLFTVGAGLWPFQGCEEQASHGPTGPSALAREAREEKRGETESPEKAAPAEQVGESSKTEKEETASSRRKIVRPSALAGTWYAGTREGLEKQVKNFLAAAGPSRGKGRVGALIAPHAGYRYAGRSQAACYKAVEGASYERVILMGPTHNTSFRGFSVAPVTHYQTPLGEIPLDLEMIEMIKRHPLYCGDVPPLAHAREHSLEIELPFPQIVLGKFKLVPILVGSIGPYERTMIACALRPFADDRTLVVASSDFTHFGSRFGFSPFSPSREKLKKLDMGAADLALKGDSDGFLNYRRDTGATICGSNPISILLSLLPAKFSGKLLSYTTSADLTGDYSDCVSYVSIAFRFQTAREELSTLSREEMDLLVALARYSMEYAVRDGKPPSEKELRVKFPPTSRLLEQRGVFVTLKVKGNLRGCIGRIFPSEPIYRSTPAMAMASALRDGRFRPVTEAELPGIAVEVSALTPPRLVSGPGDIRVGTDGVILYKGNNSAVFLPQVATEQGWDRETLLSHLARKAGLPPDAWKSGATFMTFQAEIAHEGGE
jgi:AmmeMemoRadiSam system protein B/AmmeMemoRadiSam system protein A